MNPCDQVAMEEREAVTQAPRLLEWRHSWVVLGGADGEVASVPGALSWCFG